MKMPTIRRKRLGKRIWEKDLGKGFGKGIWEKAPFFYHSFLGFFPRSLSQISFPDLCLKSLSQIFFFIVGIIGIVGNFFLCEAYFADLGAGVRPLGIGGAYVALADDANALFWNTAGLSQLENREFIASYSALYYGLDLQLYDGRRDQLGYHLLAYVHPLRTGSKLSSFGIGWTTFSSQLYSEKVLNLGYSLSFTRRFRAGLNLKLLSLNLQENEYTKLDPDLSNLKLSRIGNSLDLSALYTSLFGLNFGAVAENLRPVDMGIIETEPVPIKVALGAAHSSARTSQSLDISYRASKVNGKGDFNLKIGVEHWMLKELLALRAGYNFRFVSAGFGIRYKRLSLEVLESLDLQFDYAFLYPIGSIVDSYGSHRASISVRF